jgi:hypothetical protein
MAIDVKKKVRIKTKLTTNMHRFSTGMRQMTMELLKFCMFSLITSITLSWNSQTHLIILTANEARKVARLLDFIRHVFI